MQISTILHSKGSAVVTIDPSVSIVDAARVLQINKVGALVVSANGEHIDGILSERDIARAVGEHGPAALELSVAALMTSHVTTCALSDTVDELMDVMTEQRIRHLPVIDNGRMVGIVSIGDVVKHRLGELTTETQTLHDYINLGR
jgi:CBS domain-containing protein